MAGQINLIPEKRLNSQQKTPITRLVKNLTVILIVLFVIVGGAGGAFWFLRSQELTRLDTQYEDLKTEVLSLQQNEGRLILLQDRLGKAQTILADREQYKSLEYFVDFVGGFPTGVSITDISIEKGINKLTLSILDSQTLANVVSQLQNSGEYQNVSVESVTYTEFTNYTLVVSVL